MHDDLGNHFEKEVCAEANGEAEARPVMPVFQNLKTVAIEFDIPIEIQFVKGLDWNLVLAVVLGLVGLLLEGEVVLDGSTGILGFLILSGRHGRHNDPETSENGDAGE